MKWRPYLLLHLIFLCACNYTERDRELGLREQEIIEKEKELVSLQKNLYLKEEELNSREKRIDSLEKAIKGDSIKIIQSDTSNSAEFLNGVWSVEMICTESTCANSAVGDVQRETWNILVNRNEMLVEAVSATKVARYYEGEIDQKNINLEEARPNTGNPSETRIIIRLAVKDSNQLQGDRELIREDCRVTYLLKAQKQ